MAHSTCATQCTLHTQWCWIARPRAALYVRLTHFRCKLVTGFNWIQYSYLRINLFRSVTLKKIPFVQPEPTKEQSMTMATIGVFVGGTAFGSLVTLLVVGIVLGAVQLKRKETARKWGHTQLHYAPLTPLCYVYYNATTLLQYMLHVPINYCRKQSVAAETSISLAPDAIPMDANPSYEEVHVYEHIDKKDTKQWMREAQYRCAWTVCSAIDRFSCHK